MVMIEVGQAHMVVTVTAVDNGGRVCGMGWVESEKKKKKEKKKYRSI